MQASEEDHVQCKPRKDSRHPRAPEIATNMSPRSEVTRPGPRCMKLDDASQAQLPEMVSGCWQGAELGRSRTGKTIKRDHARLYVLKC